MRLMSIISMIIALNTAPGLLVELHAEENHALEFAQAEKYFEKYEFLSAERYYRAVFQKYRDMGNFGAYIQNQIAKCLRYQGKIEEAVAAYEQVRTDYPDSPQAGEAQESIARTYYEADRFDQAAPEFEKLANQIDQAKIQQSQDSVKGDTFGGIQASEHRERKMDALGHAAFSYDRGGNVLKALEMKTKVLELKDAK